jgi:hypothetical protein
MTALTPQVRASIVEGASSIASLRTQIQLIQSAMTEVMIEGTHYGKIPGSAKPSLWKSGAEVLCAMFRIAPMFFTEDLSTADCVRYRVRCIGRHQTSGIDLGEGVGECSSDEGKFRWRSPVCDEEFAATPPDRRREKWMRGSGGGAYAQKQVRVDAPDVANTVLKIGAKRAHIAMVLNVLAASDCFAQDLEDLPDGMIEGERKAPHRAGRRPSSQHQARPRSTGGQGFATDAQIKLIRARLNDAGMSAEDVCKRFGIDSITHIPFDGVNEALSYIADPERYAIQCEGPDEAAGAKQ